jgi:ubiquinone/menaquinone biosynthesis C-methylase UbiE
MRQVDYDAVAARYATRYERNDYTGVSQVLATFTATTRAGFPPRVLEVGCGTGHWLRHRQHAGVAVAGVDPSSGMLDVARAADPTAFLIRAYAEALPVRPQSFDRIFCINALHHFTDLRAFFREARRVVRPEGGLLTVGLDPHTGRDRWWIYEYFPEALAADRKRYPPTSAICEMMAAAGFERCTTAEVQHRPREMTLREAMERGFADRTSTSQLMVISDEEYRAGLARIHAADNGRRELVLESDLILYGTTGWAAA